MSKQTNNPPPPKSQLAGCKKVPAAPKMDKHNEKWVSNRQELALNDLEQFKRNFEDLVQNMREKEECA